MSTFVCQFCLEERGAGSGYALPCGHSFDEECLVAWLSSGVVEGRVDFSCQYNLSAGGGAVADGFVNPPHVSIEMHGGSGLCGAAVPNDVIKSLLGQSPAILEKFLRFCALVRRVQFAATVGCWTF